MPEFLVMPSVVVNAREGTIARWLKVEGDAVASGEAFAEIETDKAVIEIPSPKTGRVARIIHGDGATVTVETPIGILAEEGETEADVAQLLSTSIPTILVQPEAVGSDATTAPSAEMTRGGLNRRLFASPLARRLAGEMGILLSDINGSGPRGRILRADVEAFDTAIRAVSSTTVPVAQQSAVVNEDVSVVRSNDVEIPHVAIPHSAMRRTIAQRLSASKQTIPHFYLNAEIVVDALLELRKQINATRPAEARFSITDFLVKAAAAAFARVPACNVIWTEDALLSLQRTDISIAVATDGGLITPVVKDAGKKSLSVISDEISDLALRARNGSLKPGEHRGGSFTISNLGMYGVSDFIAIVNPPQASILAVGAIEEQIVSRELKAVDARVMRVTLSLDHRAIDGALGAQWLSSFKELLQNPMQILV
ncbi:biotin-requiring enzyme family protein (plasmid) [Ochrobactrum quorumnocens]|uniref:Dihydrolipoamide acetyltransferase component of pyruvate dehydrogenase complex n=1 Tax=Ochrobactrum quorumnocens TaxID=271865 RepID=A0A248UQD8_9HYPH|nr:2-oxo acid dehydrogenase subunit E2 [[Ochrobactrum] quorumnocens]ASV88489.1 biotin-requiring enzyme family protein [[Ochrobactrum] quorumnocens]